MKSIETYWKGWRFRSRTEARWAVFLEAAGIRFEYEPEGVILPSGPYLPDFKLIEFDLPDDVVDREPAWLEIKGAQSTEAERRRCAELAVASGQPVLLASGAPDFATQIFLFDPTAVQHAPAGMDAAHWCTLIAMMVGELAFMNAGGPEVDTVIVGRGPRDPDDKGGNPPDVSTEEDAAFERMWSTFNGVYGYVLGMRDGRLPLGEAYIGLGARLRAAYDAARSARFEFGQTDARWKS